MQRDEVVLKRLPFSTRPSQVFLQFTHALCCGHLQSHLIGPVIPSDHVTQGSVVVWMWLAPQSSESVTIRRCGLAEEVCHCGVELSTLPDANTKYLNSIGNITQKENILLFLEISPGNNLKCLVDREKMINSSGIIWIYMWSIDKCK